MVLPFTQMPSNELCNHLANVIKKSNADLLIVLCVDFAQTVLVIMYVTVLVV